MAIDIMLEHSSPHRHSPVLWSMIMMVSLIFGIPSCQAQPTSTLLWSDDFEDGDAEGWLFYDEVEGPSNWYVEYGYLNQSSNIGADQRGTFAVAGLSSWEDYTLSVDLAVTDDDYIGVIFRYQNPQNYYRVVLSSQAGRIRLDKIENDTIVNMDNITMMWPLCSFNMSVDVRGEAIKVYLNQQEYFDVSDTSFSSGRIGVMAINSMGCFYDKVEVYDQLPMVTIDPGTVITRGPYMQNVLGDSAVVMWQTNTFSNSIVEYGPGDMSTELLSSTSLTRDHEMVLRNLDQDTDYAYRVYSDTVTTEWVHFRSAKAPDQPFNFAVYGDSQLNFLRHGEIVAAVANESIDFVTHCGDVVTYGPRPDWDTEFFGPAADLFREKAVYVSIGNHSRESANFDKYFSFPDAEHETYYAFNYGNAFFIFLNNPGVAYPDAGYEDIAEGSAQYEWLESVLASNEAQSAQWRFVYGHIPVYSEGTNSDYMVNRENLIPLFETYAVDMYFAGHIHNYERGFSQGTYYVITGGGGGMLGIAPARDLPEITVQTQGHHYCTVSVNGPLLSFMAKRSDGTLIDQFIIDKTTSISNESRRVLPESLTLTAFPNPFNASSILNYTIPLAGDYQIKIYDISGRVVQTFDLGHLSLGNYQLDWNGTSTAGVQVPSGIYTCRIESGSLSNQIQITCVK